MSSKFACPINVFDRFVEMNKKLEHKILDSDPVFTVLRTKKIKTSINLEQVQEFIDECDLGKTHPTLGIMSRIIYDRLYDDTNSNGRFVWKELADHNIYNIMVYGIPIAISPFCPENTLFMLNEDFLGILLTKGE